MKGFALPIAVLATVATGQETLPLPAAMAAIRNQVRACWMVVPGSLAAETVVIMGVHMNPDGTVRDDALTAVLGEGPDIAAAEEAASRALLRCQGQGYPLPMMDYETWRYIAVRFDPATMRNG